MRRSVILLGLAGWLAGPATPAPAQVVTILHSFAGGANDGQSPNGSLIQSGSTLYGMTYYGGSASGNGNGTIFQMGIDGNNFGLIHSFAGAPGDGSIPNGSLLLSGSSLYGMTQFGGTGTSMNGTTDGIGTIFKTNTDGTGHTVLHSFAGAPGDGSYPTGSLIQYGTNLYGMTPNGGSGVGNGTGGVGTIFKTAMDGTGYTVLHTFSRVPGNGAGGSGALVQSGGFFYGMTFAGGDGGVFGGGGTIFRMAPDGTGYTTLHSFGVDANDGIYPGGSLTISGNVLFGMTASGGIAGNGTIFKMATDGAGYGVMHSFAGGPADGSQPNGSLTVVGSTLFGMTPFGGSTATPGPMGNPGDGTLFSILTDGTNYDVMHSFTGFPTGDGSFPQGDLTFAGTTLYGMTGSGGDPSDGSLGTIFSVSVPEPSSLLLLATAGASLTVLARRRPTKRLPGAPTPDALTSPLPDRATYVAANGVS
jgi:uncharacterized repeat protein (TIGR03803 family)